MFEKTAPSRSEIVTSIGFAARPVGRLSPSLDTSFISLREAPLDARWLEVETQRMQRSYARA